MSYRSDRQTSRSLLNHAHVVALRAAVGRALPAASVESTMDEEGAAVTRFMVRLRHGLSLCVSNDPNADTLFLVVRVRGGPSHALGFEDKYYQGCGSSELLSAALVLDLLRQYDSIDTRLAHLQFQRTAGIAALH